MRYSATALLIYFVLYLSLAFIWRAVVVYRATGIQPIRQPSQDDAQGYVMRMFKIVLMVCFVHLLAQVSGAEVNKAWPTLSWVAQSGLYALGWAVLAMSSAVLLLAQVQMGLSWRVGLDAQTPGPLVTHGLFARSRNPIFLSMRLSLLGQFVVLPNTVTLLELLCGELLIQIQVRLEEVHLPQIYGAAYEAYQARVPRWW